MEGEFVAARDGIQIAEHRIAAHRPDAFDAAVSDGTAPVGNDLRQIDPGDGAQSAAVRAGALRRIEGEGIGCRHIVGKPGVGTDQIAAEMLQLVVFQGEDGQCAFALVQGIGHGVFDPFPVVGPGDEFVHHQFHEVDLVAVQRPGFAQVAELAVDADLVVSAALQLHEKFAVVSFPAADQRGEQDDFLPLIALEDQVDDLFVGIADHLLPAFRREGLGGTGIEQAEEIVDLGDGTHRRTGIAAHGLLFDGDDRAQAFDLVDVGPLEDADELAGIGGKGIHIAALAFGADRVESQRRLAAARQAGDDHQLVAGNRQVDVLQVVDTGSADRYLFSFRHIRQVAGRDSSPVRSRWMTASHARAGW